MTTPTDRPSEVARIRVDAKAKRIRADLAYRRDHDEPGVHENLAEHYQADGYGLDGYPAGYPQDLKQLD